MKNDPVEPADPSNLLRQQLLLAQVRIMELEDARDELTPKLAATETQATALQVLADHKSEEAAHLARTLADLQAQYEHMRHMQHVTNEALNRTRQEQAEVSSQLGTARQQAAQAQRDIAVLQDQAGQLNGQLLKVSRELSEENAIATARLIRINELDAELRAMKSSRSWRWSAWLRSLERQLRRPPS